jgi:DNA-binding response OmpR family regulator
VVKPFSMRELLARVRALLRRVTLDAQTTPASEQPALAHALASAVPAPVTDVSSAAIIRGPLCVDSAMHTATLDGVELDLTPKEFELLQLFAEHPGRAFSREFLVERIWGYEYDGFERTVDTHITRLRKKLGPLGEKIVTIWGVGYRLVL